MNDQDPVVITHATRTPIGAFRGSLATLPASELGAIVMRSLLQQSDLDPAAIDEVILGQVLTAGAGQNPARQAALRAGIPESTPAMTINKVCGSGLKAVHLAWQALALGDADTVIAGGQESMSQAPHVLPGSRQGQALGDWALKDSLLIDGLWCAIEDIHMGETAERLAERHGIDRAQMDAFAAASQHKVAAARQAGLFEEEITPVEVPRRKAEPLRVDQDEFPRPDTTEKSLAGLRPAFRRDGSVTAGNASGINDGAAALLMMRASRAEALGLEPLARVVAFASAGVSPEFMGSGPIPATRKCLDKAGWRIGDLDLIESNEAFAAQALAVNQELGWDAERVNVCGGAIALGHPIGASGARILVTLLHALKRENLRRGLATLCIGGGQGVALAVERV